MSKLVNFFTSIRASNPKMYESFTIWGRWCLPSFNSNCDQLLKGAFADIDNSLCDGKTIKKKIKYEEIIPWENPSLMVFVNMYGR